MSNINENIKKLLAFLPQFDEFKSKVDKSIVGVESSVGELGKQCQVISTNLSKLEKDIAKKDIGEDRFESARRTFGDQIATLKSFLDKELKRVEDDKAKQTLVNKSTAESDKKIKSILQSLSDINKHINSESKADKDVKLINAAITDLKKKAALIDEKADLKEVKGEIKSTSESTAKSLALKADKSKFDNSIADIERSIKSISESKADKKETNSKIEKLERKNKELEKSLASLTASFNNFKKAFEE